jgi:hypothetical protein
MHVTMMVKALYNACKDEIELRWTLYKQIFIDSNGNMIEPHSPEDEFNKNIKYEIWGYNGIGAFVESNAIKLKETTDIGIDTLRNITANSTYYLYIKALLPNNDTSTTYRLEIETINRKEPQYINIDSVISANGRVELYFNVDKTTELDTFALYRSDIERPLQWYRGEIPNRYVDQDIQLGLSYDYYLAAFRCSKIVKQSDTVNNIPLILNRAGQSIQLKWAKFTTKPSAYEIRRIEPDPITYPAMNDLYTYIDDIRLLLENGSFNYCYSLKADNTQSIARSDIQCITIDPVVNMPDAINPLSEITNSKTGISRNRFGPILSFADDKYRFTLDIFNKAGIRLFTSNKEFEQELSIIFHYWDGRYNNDYVKEDVYIYSIKFEFKNRKPFIQNGTVTVIYK